MADRKIDWGYVLMWVVVVFVALCWIVTVGCSWWAAFSIPDILPVKILLGVGCTLVWSFIWITVVAFVGESLV